MSTSENVRGILRSNKESKKSKRAKIVWDEENLQTNENEKTPKMKIDEPKTPFVSYVLPDDDQNSSASSFGRSPHSPVEHSFAALEQRMQSIHSALAHQMSPSTSASAESDSHANSSDTDADTTNRSADSMMMFDVDDLSTNSQSAAVEDPKRRRRLSGVSFQEPSVAPSHSHVPTDSSPNDRKRSFGSMTHSPDSGIGTGTLLVAPQQSVAADWTIGSNDSDHSNDDDGIVVTTQQKKQFESKRKAHYDEFKRLQRFRQKKKFGVHTDGASSSDDDSSGSDTESDSDSDAKRRSTQPAVDAVTPAVGSMQIGCDSAAGKPK